MGAFTFGTFDTDAAGLIIGGQNTFNFARRDRTFVPIQGRNGDLIVDNGRYVNSTVIYAVFVPDNFAEKRDALIHGLTSQGSGYVKLRDTYHPQKYRMAVLDTDIEFATGMLNRYGRCDIVFDCMPQIFLDAGDEEVILPSTGGDVEILGEQPSLPMIKVYTADSMSGEYIGGSISIDDFQITIGRAANIATSSIIYIDCEAQVIRKENSLITSGITLIGDFPKLDPNANNSGICHIESSISDVDHIGVMGKWWGL